MTLDLIARIKTKEDFLRELMPGDEQKKYNGISLIFSVLTNRDPQTRVDLAKLLMDNGADILSPNNDGETVLHVYLGQLNNDPTTAASLCKIFIEKGVDINALDKNSVLALQYIVNIKLDDEKMKPLYDLWFSQNKVDFCTKNRWNCSPLDIAKKMPYRSELVKRMECYEQ